MVEAVRSAGTAKGERVTSGVLRCNNFPRVLLSLREASQTCFFLMNRRSSHHIEEETDDLSPLLAPERPLLAEYVEHYNAARPHQGLGNRSLSGGEPAEGVGETAGEVYCRKRLGVLLKHYWRRAA